MLSPEKLRFLESIATGEDAMHAARRVCSTCGSQHGPYVRLRCDDGWANDTLLFFCRSCTADIAQPFGFLTPEAARDIEERATAETAAVREQLDTAEQTLAQLRAAGGELADQVSAKVIAFLEKQKRRPEKPAA